MWAIIVGLFLFLLISLSISMGEKSVKTAQKFCITHDGIQQLQVDTLWSADFVICKDGNMNSLD